MTNTRQDRLTAVANIEDAITRLRPLMMDQTRLTLASWAVGEARALLTRDELAPCLSTADGLLNIAMQAVENSVKTIQGQRPDWPTAA